MDEKLFDFESAIEKAIRKLLKSYFNSQYKMSKSGEYYVIKDRNSDEILYGGILLKSVAKTATYCLVTDKRLYLNQLLKIDRDYQKLYSEYVLAKHSNDHKPTIHHRDRLEYCAEGMRSLKKALSLRIYLTVNPSASF